MEIIKLTDISFRYAEQNGSETFYLENLDLLIKKGDFISILGPNGSGKSTLLKIIANIITPLSGKTFLYDNSYDSYKRMEFAKHIAFVPQNSGTNLPVFDL